MIRYSLIEIYTSEDMHWSHKPLYLAIIDLVRTQKTAARCIVTRAMEGCYENGEVATSRFEVWSLRMPLKIEILLPETELAPIIPALKEMVADGIVTIREATCISHRSEKHLIPRHLIVRDIMTRDPVAVKPETPIRDIISLFVAKGFCSAPIVNNENIPVGIITETDLINKTKLPVRLGLLTHFEDKIDGLLTNFQKMTAKDIMSTPVHSVSQDEYLTKAVDILLKHKIKRLPVVTKDGILSGILTIYDVFQTVSEHVPDSTIIQKHVEMANVKTVRDVVITACPKVSADTPIEDVVRIIDGSPLQRIAVVDSVGKLLGLVFDHDLLILFSEHKETIWDHLLSAVSFTEMGRIHKDKIRKHPIKTASEIMRTDLVTVDMDAPVDSAMRVISEKNIRFLPVVDKGGGFVGVISREALLTTKS